MDAFHRELVDRHAPYVLTEIAFTRFDSRHFAVTGPLCNRLRFWENNPPGIAGSAQ